MQFFSPAGVADILRCNQRDEGYVRQMQDSIQTIVNALSNRRYHTTHRIVPVLTNSWYYCMTTLGDLQTLGEEYAGIMRVGERLKIPSKTVELLWMLLYIGGEPLCDRLLQSLQNKVQQAETLTEQAQSTFSTLLTFLQQNKSTFRRLHHSLFYIFGKYYNISNRLMGIKYILLRDWLKDDTFTNSFKLLGRLLLFYILFDFAREMWKPQGNKNMGEYPSHLSEVSKKCCVLCTENRKNPCTTPCGHIFCWDCICDSLTYQRTCPVCREVVLPSRIVFLQNYI